MLKPMLSTDFQNAAMHDAIGMVRQCFDLGDSVLPGVRPHLSIVKEGLQSIEKYHEEHADTFKKMCDHYGGKAKVGPFVELLESESKALKPLMRALDYAIQYIDSIEKSAEDLEKANLIYFKMAREYLDDDFLGMISEIDQATEGFKSALGKGRWMMEALYDNMEQLYDWQSNVVLHDDERVIPYSADIEGTPYQVMAATNAGAISQMVAYDIQVMMQVQEIRNRLDELAEGYKRLSVECIGYLDQSGQDPSPRGPAVSSP